MKPAIMINGSALRTIRDLSLDFAVAMGTTGRADTSLYFVLGRHNADLAGLGREYQLLVDSQNIPGQSTGVPRQTQPRLPG